MPQEEGEKAKRFILEFDLKEGESVQVKVALSTVGIEGAKVALDKENPGWNFESIKAETNGKWNDMLSLAEVEGTEEEKMNFYTSMYHLFIQPTNIADIDGKYRGLMTVFLFLLQVITIQLSLCGIHIGLHTLCIRSSCRREPVIWLKV